MKTYISLFSSAGVGCYGLKENGFECVATSELLEPRLKIQRLNKKCKYDTGYILGDIKDKTNKKRIFDEIDYWKKEENVSDIDVVIATPPCQGISTANYKKKNEQERNSLVVEAITLIKSIQPKVFILENVRSFITTACTDTNGEIKTIGQTIDDHLGELYVIEKRMINFKDYGVPSSRPRTLVIGTRKTEKYMSPLNLFPLPEKQISLRDAIGNMKAFSTPGEYDKSDCLHFFRAYDDYMRVWIHDLKEGESAFNNDENKRPYRIIDGKKVPLKSGHLGNKFRRLYWDKPCACVTTRNDQLAAMDTIHPRDDRVLSIRELMKVMTIPDDFIWVRDGEKECSSIDEHTEYLRKNELSIRRCIGEAVPTRIIGKIARNLSDMLDFSNYLNGETTVKDNIYIKSYINEQKNSSKEAKETGTFYTPQSVVYDCLSSIKAPQKTTVKVLEPSVGGGNFIIPIISTFYNSERIIIDIVDINESVLNDTFEYIMKYNFDRNRIVINKHHADFIEYTFPCNYDYIIGNPPYVKISKEQKLKYKGLISFDCENMFGLFLEKAYNNARNIIMVLPKVFLMVPEYNSLRKKYQNYNVVSVSDYGVNAFEKVFIEIIAIHFTKEQQETISINNYRDNEFRIVKQGYIFHEKIWIIYRDAFFDAFISKLELGVFDFFRDRQITKGMMKGSGKYWVLKSKNIQDDGSIVHICGYDRYIDNIDGLAVKKYMNTDVIIMPNFTYNLRASVLPKNVLVNGSVALLIFKDDLRKTTNIDLSFFSSSEYRRYYSLVKNKSKFTLNIDNNSIYYIGIKR